MMSSEDCFSKRSPVWTPRNDIERFPSITHQSPFSSRTTCGARSRKARSMRESQRSGGSMMWESEEMRIELAMLASAAARLGRAASIPPGEGLAAADLGAPFGRAPSVSCWLEWPSLPSSMARCTVAGAGRIWWPSSSAAATARSPPTCPAKTRWPACPNMRTRSRRVSRAFPAQRRPCWSGTRSAAARSPSSRRGGRGRA